MHHICANILSNVIFTNIIKCPSIRGHDAPYIAADIPTNEFQLRFENIRILENFKMDKSISDFKLYPFSIVHSFDEINNQLGTLNRLITEYLKKAPLKKVKFTRPPASRIKDLDIIELQQDRNYLR